LGQNEDPCCIEFTSGHDCRLGAVHNEGLEKRVGLFDLIMTAFVLLNKTLIKERAQGRIRPMRIFLKHLAF
jgi:hypothetical protein